MIDFISPSGRTPLPHQIEALEWATGRNHIALFMEMRLGKTATAIWWAVHVKKLNGPILVVAPLTVLSAWEEELALECEVYVNLHETWQVPDFDGGRVWYLANYEMFRGKHCDILLYPWLLVALDESVRIRNPQAVTTKLALEYFRDVQHRVILCGLPAPESEINLFCQLAFLTGQFMGHYSYWKWLDEHFCQPVFEWIPKPGAREKIKKAQLDKAFIKTRKEVNLGSTRIYEVRDVEIEPIQRRHIKTIREGFYWKDAAGVYHETKYLPVVETWVQRVAGGFTPDGLTQISRRKITELLNLLETELKRQQIVLWFRFRSELEAVEVALADYKTVHIHGDTPLEDRKTARQTFQAGKAQIMLATEQTAKRGLDFSAADTAIYYSNSYDGDDRAQSEDRIIHPNKKGSVLIIDLCTKETPDRLIAVKAKTKTFNARDLMQDFLGHAGKNLVLKCSRGMR